MSDECNGNTIPKKGEREPSHPEYSHRMPPFSSLSISHFAVNQTATSYTNSNSTSIAPSPFRCPIFTMRV